jgi:hypothetical protein
MTKTLIAAAAIALSSPAAALAVPPSHAGGPHGSPPGLSDNDHGSSTKTPAAWCVEERKDLGVGKFNDEYGTNANESNAFGQCVSARAQDRDDD